MEAHVICCNDGVEYVVVGNKEKAESKMAELSAAYFDLNRWHFGNDQAYKVRCYWHIHTVGCESE